VVFVSSLWSYKNHGGLLRAWARARPQLGGRQLVFVGAGPDSYAAGLRSLAAELGIGNDLIFTGGVSLVETVAFYRAADLLAYPSHNETFGLPILEAMACGCPVVTSQVSSMPEIAGGTAIPPIPPIPPPSPRPWWPGWHRTATGCAIWGSAGRPSSPGQPRPPRRSTSTARWPSADGGDEHRFLVNRPSRAPPELHTGARLPWQAA
jgi:Glycosyl transferases group 1